LTEIPALAGKKGMERRILEGTVAELSPKKALSVGPGDTLAKAVETMRQAKVGCVLVVERAELVGVLSEREILFKAAESADLSKIQVGEIMRSRPTVLLEGDQVADAFNRMAMSGHRHVPVQMRDGSHGVISARDLLRYLCK
jgi:CBS domain-containing protein